MCLRKGYSLKALPPRSAINGNAPQMCVTRWSGTSLRTNPFKIETALIKILPRITPIWSGEIHWEILYKTFKDLSRVCFHWAFLHINISLVSNFTKGSANYDIFWMQVCAYVWIVSLRCGQGAQQRVDHVRADIVSKANRCRQQLSNKGDNIGASTAKVHLPCGVRKPEGEALVDGRVFEWEQAATPECECDSRWAAAPERTNWRVVSMATTQQGAAGICYHGMTFRSLFNYK